jgi:hypothetical protein
MPNSIIADIVTETINQAPCELITLHNGLIIALSASALSCYKNIDSLHDPLGNGLLSFADIHPDHPIQFKDKHCIATHTSGFVGLLDGKALLIAPFKVRLYPNNHDGLRGLNCLAELDLPEIDVL